MSQYVSLDLKLHFDMCNSQLCLFRVSFHLCCVFKLIFFQGFVGSENNFYQIPGKVLVVLHCIILERE